MDIPRLTNALDAVSRTSDNVYTSLDWLLTQALVGPVEHCYLPEGVNLIRAAAAATPSEALAAQAKLKARFGKDFNIPRFRTCVREAKESLTVPTETSLIEGQNGPKPLLANAIAWIESSAIKVAYDEFSAAITQLEPSPWGGNGRWRDEDDGEATNLIQHSNISVGSITTHEAIYIIAKRNKFHPVKDYLSALEWDGQPRVGVLLPYYFETKDGAYAREVSRMWMVSLIARIFDPGCMCKYMIVLEGEQDDGKSKGLRALANGHLGGNGGTQWYRDRLPRLSHARSQEVGQFLQGVWIIEVAELAGFQRSEQEDVKSFISTQTDTFRSPYGRNIQEYPRQCVFAGTVNVNKGSTPEWGKDPTGLVRFWPIRTGRPRVIVMDPEHPTGMGVCIVRDRKQLLAEAVHMYKAGDLWYPDPTDNSFNDLARQEQADRMPDNPLKEQIFMALMDFNVFGQKDDISVGEICDRLRLDADRKSSMIGRALNELGWVKFRRRGDGGEALPRYQRPAKTE